MLRLMRRPRWIAFTLLIVALMVTMVNLGLWQLRRLDQRQQQNHDVTSRSAMAVVPLTDLVAVGADRATVKSSEWRVVEATGTFDEAGQVFIRDRSSNGAAGDHVVTPLALADGTVVLVNRGWVPASSTVGADPIAPAPPPGTVTVDGRVRPSQLRGLIGPRDPATGRLTAFARVDIARIGQQITAPLLPAYLELTSPAPSGDLPRLVPPPELDDGPHLSYALQWFSFTLMAAATWWLMLRRSAKAATKSSLARAAAAVAATAAIEAEAASGPAAISGESDRPAG